MKFFPVPVQNLQLSKLWLLVLAGCLIFLHFHITWQAKLMNLLVTSFIFFVAIFYKIRKKYNILTFKSSFFSQLLGTLLITFVASNSLLLRSDDFLIRLLPFVSALGLAVIASGIKALKQYGQEIILILVLAIPLERLLEPVNNLIGVTTIIAQISTFILWYLGFEVSRQGETIILPMKATWVGPNCSGILTMLWMLQLAILFLAMVPTKLYQKILVPLAAVLIVFLVNGIRVAIMAVLAAHNYQAFEYWHSDNAQIFSTIPILIFWWFCQFIMKQNRIENES